MTIAEQSAAEAFEVADRLAAAIEAKDVDGFAALYADGAVIWHNNDRTEQSVEENLGTLRMVFQYIPDMRYEDVRRYPTENGFIEQHVVRGTTTTGKTIDAPVVLVCEVADGKLTRVEEYLDSAHFAG